MAVKFGYGGLANTNGARDFTGKAEAAPEVNVHFSSRWFLRCLLGVFGA